MSTTKRKPKAEAKTEGFDFDDEQAVLAEVCKDLDEDPEDAEIEEDRGLRSFRVGTFYQISFGQREYAVAKDDDAAHELAIAIVEQDLEESPEIFNQSFIEGHIDEKNLASELQDDVESERHDYYNDIAEDDPDRFWEEAAQYGVEKPEPEDDEEDDSEDPEPSDDDIEKVAEASAKELLKDPMQYLEDIYGREDAVKQAIKIAGIDVEAAAEEAVNTDGEGHFLSSYDGATHETKSGLVYWRTN